MTREEITSRIALSMMEGMTPELARHMAESGITPDEWAYSDMREIADRLGGRVGRLLDWPARDRVLTAAAGEVPFVERNRIDVFSLPDPEFPTPLYDIATAPIILYRLGDCPLEGPHMISIVGTRNCTSYGAGAVKTLVEGLAVYFPDLIVVSGLAYGIDVAAHKAALDNRLRTIAVVAHGLDMVYPADHRDIAARIVRSGGAIVTEYPSGTRPYKGRFLERNRIVAGLSQGTLVAESDIRGGSMATARNALSFGREVMAVPGRITDNSFRGCNDLIHRQIASIVTGAPDIMETLGWQPDGMNIDLSRRNLFPELDGDTRRVYDLLRYESAPMTLDNICHRLSMPVHTLSALLSEMEFDSLVRRHPGNRYSAEC